MKYLKLFEDFEEGAEVEIHDEPSGDTDDVKVKGHDLTIAQLKQQGFVIGSFACEDGEVVMINGMDADEWLDNQGPMEGAEESPDNY
jgi:hypothetical protein